jgi:ribonuclease HI
MTNEPAIHVLKEQLEWVLTQLTLRSETQGTRAVPKPGRYLLNTDAGVRKGKAAIGVVLSDPDDNLVAIRSEKIGRAMIQEAEYKALIRGLELALDHGIQKVRAYLDNQLVVDQINGLAAVNSKTLVPLHGEALELLKKFPDQRRCPCQKVYWVPRERNKAADALVKRELY